MRVAIWHKVMMEENILGSMASLPRAWNRLVSNSQDRQVILHLFRLWFNVLPPWEVTPVIGSSVHLPCVA